MTKLFLVCLFLFFLFLNFPCIPAQEVTSPSPSLSPSPQPTNTTTTNETRSWFSTPAVLMALAGMILGIFFLVFGYRFYYVYLFTLGFVIAGGLLFLLMGKTKTDWLAKMLLSLIVGAIFGTVSLLIYWLGLFLAGGFVGVIVSAIIVPQVDRSAIDWVIIICLVFGMGVLTMIRWFQKTGIILSSSFCGAYAFVAGMDYLASGKGEISKLFPQLINGFTNIVPVGLTWAYVALILFLTLVGMFIQFRWSGKDYVHSPLIVYNSTRTPLLDDDIELAKI